MVRALGALVLLSSWAAAQCVQYETPAGGASPGSPVNIGATSSMQVTWDAGGYTTEDIYVQLQWREGGTGCCNSSELIPVETGLEAYVIDLEAIAGTTIVEESGVIFQVRLLALDVSPCDSVWHYFVSDPNPTSGPCAGYVNVADDGLDLGPSLSSYTVQWTRDPAVSASEAVRVEIISADQVNYATWEGTLGAEQAVIDLSAFDWSSEQQYVVLVQCLGVEVEMCDPDSFSFTAGEDEGDGGDGGDPPDGGDGTEVWDQEEIDELLSLIGEEKTAIEDAASSIEGIGDGVSEMTDAVSGLGDAFGANSHGPPSPGVYSSDAGGTDGAIEALVPTVQFQEQPLGPAYVVPFALPDGGTYGLPVQIDPRGWDLQNDTFAAADAARGLFRSLLAAILFLVLVTRILRALRQY